MAGGRHNKAWQGSWRIRLLKFLFVGGFLIIVAKMFSLQIVSASFYRALAEGQHSLYEELVPERGRIVVRDHDDPTEYPVATNEPRAFVYADPRLVEDPVKLGKDIAKILQLPGAEVYEREELIASLRAAGRNEEADALISALVPIATPADALAELAAPIAGEEAVDLPVTPPAETPAPTEEPAEENEVGKLIARLSKADDPYEPVARDVAYEQWKLIEDLKAEGIYAVMEDGRSYPETGFGGHVLGFLGRDAQGQPLGQYGLEGFFEDFLSGQLGSLYSQTDRSGNWIGIGDRNFQPAIDGGDLLLTIDRQLQVTACDMLRRGVERFKAEGGALVIIEPSTGKILAMCGAPDFAPPTYNEVESVSVYNNPTVFTPYEPGSIFKPITMAAALDAGAVSPESRFTDPGSVTIDKYTIKNANENVFGNVSMIEVLEESINTGMVWVMRQMGRDTFTDYVKKFGFGQATGVTLNSEVAGTVASLDEKAEIYAATASFGQGITTTPLQMTAAYAAIANGGVLMKPQIIDEYRYPDGTVEKVQPEEVHRVMSEETATKLSAMLVSVVEYGHGKRAGVPGYYIAGKTGTAQIAKNGVYSATDFNGSFAGFGPVGDPRFAMIVKIENPQDIIFAEATAAPIFGEIADYLLEYYDVPPTRTD